MSAPDGNGNSDSGARSCLCREICYRNCGDRYRRRRSRNAYVGSGALFGSTPSSPFSATRNYNSFGSFAGESNRCTSSSPLFGTQNSSPFGNTVGGALNGSTSPSPFFGTQNPPIFGNEVGNTNGPSGESNRSTSSSPFFATQNQPIISNGSSGAFNDYTPAYAVVTNQSLKPFGFGTAPSMTFPFKETSPSSKGFGSAKTSPFGQTPSVFGGFGATSTTPLFGKTDPSFSTFREASSTTPTSTPQTWTTFPPGGGGLAISDNSCEGTRCAPYRPTPEENNLSCNNGSRDVLTSISAMNCYCNKNHEELRLEDYKQIRNQGYSSAAHASVFSNPFSVSSTNPSQPANSPGWFPPSDFAFRRSSENPFQKTGGSPAIIDNSCGEARAPYQPTPFEENNLPWNNGRCFLTSISAMNCYCNKSHEELRLEYNKQIRNGGPSSAALPNPFSVPSTNPVKPANSSGWFPPCELPRCTFDRSSENTIQKTDSSSSLGSDNNHSTPAHTSTVQTSVSQTRPFPIPTTTTTASRGISFIPSFVNCIIPAFGAFDINGGQPVSLELGTPVLGFPVLIPTSALPLLQPETHFNPRMIPPNSISTASTSTPAAATSSRVSPSAGILGQQNSNSSTSAPAPAAAPAPTTATFSESAFPSDFNLPATQFSSSIPKALEIIVDHLGFNPWVGKSHFKDSQDRQFLLCEDAFDDADILSLAEFAVEQHNAIEQNVVKVELLKVTAACLEAVDGGRYHIVLEASSGTRFYAAVRRKNTDRSTPLVVLERWLQPSIVI